MSSFWIVHAALLAFAAAVASRFDGSLFFWHPCCMAFYLLLQVEAVLAMKGAFGDARTNDRIKRHLWLQAGAAVSAAAGFGAIYYNKDRYGKAHFMTWHAVVGLAALPGTVSAFSFGWLLDPRDNKFLRGLVGLRRLPLCYRLHGWFGRATVLCVAGACLAGLWVAPSSGWAQRKFGAGVGARGALSAAVGVGTLVGLFGPAAPVAAATKKKA